MHYYYYHHHHCDDHLKVYLTVRYKNCVATSLVPQTSTGLFAIWSQAAQK